MADHPIEMACADDEQHMRPGPAHGVPWWLTPKPGAKPYPRIVARDPVWRRLSNCDPLPIPACVAIIVSASIALWAMLVVMAIALVGAG